MKQIIIFFSLLIFNFTGICANIEKQIEEERNLNSFTAIDVTQGIEVNLIEGDIQKVTVKADEHMMSSVKTEVHGQTLKLIIDDRYKKLLFGESTVVIDIVIPKLRSISANAASKVIASSDFNTDDLTLSVTSDAEIEFRGKITANKLELNTNSLGKFTSKSKSKVDRATFVATSNGEITINVEVANDIECSATSHGKIQMNGKADNALLSATTYSEIKMKGFKAKVVNALATTSAVIEISVLESLAATATNDAVISYSGKPESVNKETTTGGKIR